MKTLQDQLDVNKGNTCGKMRQRNITKEKTYFKNPNRCTCMDLFVTNRGHSIITFALSEGGFVH